MFKKKIIIFSEYSKKIGHGHLIRSTRIFDILKKSFNVVLFVNKDVQFIKKKIISDNSQLIIFDFKYYPINFSKFNKKIFYFFFETKKNFGTNSLSIDALDLSGRSFTGPKWYPYPKTFFSKNIEIKKKQQNILITQGFTDAHNNLIKICTALLPLKKKFKFNLFIKTNNKIKLPEKFLIINNIKEINFKKDISKVYKKIDMAITGVGNTCFELNFFNIKCIYVSSEKREIKRAKLLEKKNFGHFCNITKNKEFIKKFTMIFNKKKVLKKQDSFFRHNGMQNIINLIKKYENYKN